MEILEYQDFEETISLTDYSSNKAWYPGEYSENTEIGEKDGETYFIKDKKTGQGLMMPYVLVDIVTDDIGVDLKIEYDTESGKIIRPEIYGVPTDEFIPGVSGFFDKLTGKPFGPEPEKIYEASALKYFISDSDLAPNIVVNEEIAVHIDFQRAGSTARHFYSEFLNDLEEVFDHLHREFSQKEFEEILNSHAKEADIKGLEENLLEGLETHETFKTDNRENAIVGRTLENYERFR